MLLKTVLLLALNGAVGNDCIPCCSGLQEGKPCEVAACPYGATQIASTCYPCDYAGVDNVPENTYGCDDLRRHLRGAGGRKTLFGSSEPEVTLADGCCWLVQP